jgi:hypothetical protein
MRKPSKRELGLMVGVVIATGLTHADENLPEVIVQGYQYAPFPWLTAYAGDSDTTPKGGSGPGGAYSANPNTHVNCAVNKLSAAINSNGTIGPANPAPQPDNTALNVPVRYDNPIDVTSTQPVCARYGGSAGSKGFCVFPSLAAGGWAASYSAGNYAIAGYSITGLIDVWAPPNLPGNENALSTTLSVLGISPALGQSTLLTDLTASQLMQVIAAFAWQEGYNPSGC